MFNSIIRALGTWSALFGAISMNLVFLGWDIAWGDPTALFAFTLVTTMFLIIWFLARFIVTVMDNYRNPADPEAGDI